MGTTLAVPYRRAVFSSVSPLRALLLSPDWLRQARRRARTVHSYRDRIQERHSRSQFAPHFFDGVRRFLAPHLVKLLAARFVLPDPVGRKSAILHLLHDLI